MRRYRKIINRTKVESFTAFFLCCTLFFFTTGFLGFKPSLEKLNAEIDEKFPDAPTVLMEELEKMMAEEPSLVLIDAREPEEYAVSHLEKAVHIVEPENLPYEKDRLIVVYCSVGYRSAEFVAKARRLGFTNIFNYRGSIFEWANKGNPVYRNGRLVKKVHPYNSYWGNLLNQELHSDY